jgi:hypothetical protein
VLVHAGPTTTRNVYMQVIESSVMLAVNSHAGRSGSLEAGARTSGVAMSEACRRQTRTCRFMLRQEVLRLIGRICHPRKLFADRSARPVLERHRSQLKHRRKSLASLRSPSEPSLVPLAAKGSKASIVSGTGLDPKLRTYRRK